MGTKQLVVQDAFDTTKSFAGSYWSSFTPTTKVASASLAGAEMITREAPASRWAAASEREVNRPVDSTTTSTPSESHGSAFGSRSERTAIGSPSTTIDASATPMSPSKRPCVESKRSRWARVFGEVRSFTATTSTSAPIDRAALK